MPEILKPNCLSAWQEGVKQLRKTGGKLFNLVTTIEAPQEFDANWLKTFSPNSVLPNADRLDDVIDTVFPLSLRSRYQVRTDLYDAYLRIHKRAKKWPRNRTRWGTYFERLINFNGKANQLENVIKKLRTWKNRNTTGLVFHLSSPDLDSLRTRGGPCWHYGEILWRQGDILDLVAVYRNHDFFNKTFGNFLALGQLLRFIAEESEKTSGRLICHSVHAYSERPLHALATLAKV